MAEESVWKVFMVDRRPGAPSAYRDVSVLYDAPASRPPEEGGTSITTGFLRLVDLDKLSDLNPDSFCEFHEGYYFVAAAHWDDTKECHGYFVQSHRTFFEGGVRHCFEAETADYNLLFEKTKCLSWPTDIATAASAGYPAGWSVRDWLTGTISGGKPYDGVIAYHFPGAGVSVGRIDIGGIDPVFTDILLDAEHWPTMANVDAPEEFGMFGFCGLRDVLDEIMKYARYAALDGLGLDVLPQYGFRSVVHPGDPTRIAPQFYCIDLNDAQGTATAVARYSITPDIGGGIYPVEAPLEHERDARSAISEVIVMADGDRADGFIWSARDKAEAVDRYPCWYNRRGHWTGMVLNPDIQTQAECDGLADRIIDVMWGPRGRLKWTARAPFSLKVADAVELHFPPEGQVHHVLPVLSVAHTRTPGAQTMRITAGERDISVEDILFSRAATPLIRPETGGGRGGQAGGEFAGGSGRPAPRQRPLQNVVMQSLQNVVQGINNTVTPLVVAANPRTVSAATEEDPDALVPGADIFRTVAWNGLAWVRQAWVDRYGTLHPNIYPHEFTDNGTIHQVIARRMTIREAHLSGTATGVTVAYARRRSGTTTTVTIPFELLVNDELHVVVSGGTFTGGLYYCVTVVSGVPL